MDKKMKENKYISSDVDETDFVDMKDGIRDDFENIKTYDISIEYDRDFDPLGDPKIDVSESGKFGVWCKTDDVESIIKSKDKEIEELKENVAHYKLLVNDYRELWFDRELGNKNPVVIENISLNSQIIEKDKQIESMKETIESAIIQYPSLTCEKLLKEEIDNWK